MSTAPDRLHLRAATARDARAVAEVLVEAGVAAWATLLGEERIRAANAGRTHPADVAAEGAEGVCGFVAWDAQTGEVTRLYVHPRRWRAGAPRVRDWHGARLVEPRYVKDL